MEHATSAGTVKLTSKCRATVDFQVAMIMEPHTANCLPVAGCSSPAHPSAYLCGFRLHDRRAVSASPAGESALYQREDDTPSSRSIAPRSGAAGTNCSAVKAV